MGPQSNARELGNVQKPRRFCVQCLLDVVTILALLILAPVLLVLLLLVCTVPIIERLFHPCRQYMDGVSSAYINHIIEAVIHGMVVSKERKDAESVFQEFDKNYVTTT